jgi:hypothetical protein
MKKNLLITALALLFFSVVSHSQTTQTTKLSVLLLLNQNGGSRNTADGLVALFADNYSGSIGNEDSYKFTNPDENIAIYRYGKNLSIEGRPHVTSTDTLPFRMWKFRQKSYFLKLAGSNFPVTNSAVLKDAYLKKETSIALSDTTVVAFNITGDSASFAPDRFSVVLKNIVIPPVSITEFKAYNWYKRIQVAWKSKFEGNVLRYEIEKSTNGTDFNKAAIIAVKEDNVSEEEYSWNDANTIAGNNFYRVKVVEKTGYSQLSSIVAVDNTISIKKVNIFPNPVKGNLIHLQIDQLEKGTYQVFIYNQQGQRIYTNTISNTDGSISKNIVVDKQLTKGMYTLQLVNGNAVTNKLLVFD